MKTYTVELVKRETKDDFVVKMVNEFGNRSVYPQGGRLGTETGFTVSVSIPDTREAETKFMSIYDSLPEEG